MSDMDRSQCCGEGAWAGTALEKSLLEEKPDGVPAAPEGAGQRHLLQCYYRKLPVRLPVEREPPDRHRRTGADRREQRLHAVDRRLELVARAAGQCHLEVAREAGLDAVRRALPHPQPRYRLVPYVERHPLVELEAV